MVAEIIPLSRLKESPKQKVEWWAKPWTHASPTQIEAYNNCPRYWYLAWIIGPRPDQKPAQRLGDEIHIELEHYVKNEGVIRASKHMAYVRAAAEKIPKGPYAPHILAERRIKLPSYDGGPLVVGKIDLTDLRNLALPDTWDYKTSKDIRAYAKKPEELRGNIQMLTYAYEALTVQAPDAKETITRHLYLQTQGPKIAHPVTVRMSRQEVADGWGWINGIIRKMQDLAVARPLDFRDVTPNFDHCKAFGGCQYRERCGTDKGQPDFSTFDGVTGMGEKPSSGGRLAALMAAKNQQAKNLTEGASPPQPAPPQTGAATRAAVGVVTWGEKMTALRGRGFTDEEIKRLRDEEAVEDAVTGKVTPGMLRYRGAQEEAKAKPQGIAAEMAAKLEAVKAEVSGAMTTGGAPSGAMANAVCQRCQGKKMVPSRDVLGDEGSKGGVVMCPVCKGTGIASGPVATTGQTIPPDAPTRDLKIGDEILAKKGETKIYSGPQRVATREDADGVKHIVAEVSALPPQVQTVTPEVPEPAPVPLEPAPVPLEPAPVPLEPAKRGRGRPRKTLSTVEARLEQAKAERAAAVEGQGTPAAQAQLEAAETSAKARVTETAARVEALPTIEQKKAQLVEASRPLAEAVMLSVADRIEEIADSRGENEMSAAAMNLADDVRNGRLSNPAPIRAETAAAAVCTVYIDCFPVRGRDTGAAVDAEEWLYPIKQRVETQQGMLDYRLKDFAHGKGMVIAAIRAEAAKALPPVVFVSGRSDLGQMFLEAIKPFKLNVIKGSF